MSPLSFGAAARRCACFRTRACAWLLAALVLAAPAWARAPLRDAGALRGFDHAAWPVERGAPGDIWDMAQAEDGALWLATGSGLYRFDGQRFEPQSPPAGQAFPSRNMTTLERGPDGTLWIGTFNAGVTRLAHGRLTSFGEAQGIPGGLIPRIAYDGDGRLWAAVDGGLRWFDGTRWWPPAASLDYPAQKAQWLLRDRRGTLWVSTGRTIVYLPRHGTRFIATGQVATDFASLAESPEGEVWLADRQRGLMPLADARGLLPVQARRARTLPILAARVRFASDGNLWASGYNGHGVFRVRFDGAHAPCIERFNVEQGLTSTYAAPVLQDREGNVWVGTNQGLDRFRPDLIHALDPALVPDWEPHTLFQAGDGRVYAYGDEQRPVLLDRALATATPGRAAGAPGHNDTVVWSLIGGEARWQRGDEVHPAPLPDMPERQYVHAMQVGGSDQVWACVGRRYVMRYDGRQWRRESRLPPQACSVLALDQGTVTLGYPDGVLRLLGPDGVQTYTTAQGLRVGPLTGVYRQDGVLLAAGEDGLAALGADGRFHPVPSPGDGQLDGINGMARDEDGQLWLFGIRGLVRTTLEDLLRSAHTGTPLRIARLFDGIDGLPGLSRQASAVPTLAVDPDGLLWMSTNHGVAWLDTRTLHRNPVPPTVRIGNISFNQTREPLGDAKILPKGTTQLQIDYAATSMTRPDLVRYRTRLFGLEENWHDADQLTHATYANLAPGAYRFEVMAANEDGVWQLQPAARDFSIAPTFVQTSAFKLLCLVLFTLLLALVMRLRSEQVARQVSGRLEASHQERERIARELHDTLLQGTQGLILRLHAAAERLAPGDPLRDELNRAMDLAEQAVAQGRERVQCLRQNALRDQELGVALLAVRDEWDGPDLPQLRLLLEGEPRPLQPCTAEEAFLICREALLNAFRHAQAEAIEIEVGYGRGALSVRIRDNGRGLPAEGVQRRGHFGLRGMRERATRIGADLQLWSRPHAGTEVQLRVPRARAYLVTRPPGRWSGWRLRTLPPGEA